MSYSTFAEAVKMAPKFKTVALGGTLPNAQLDTDKCEQLGDRYINMKLRGYYNVPFATAPDDIKTIAEMLYIAYAGRIRYTEDDPRRVESTNFWDDANELLAQIRGGQIKLDKAQASISTDEDYAKQDVDGDEAEIRPIFDSDNEMDWEVPTTERYPNKTNKRYNTEDLTDPDGLG